MNGPGRKFRPPWSRPKFSAHAPTVAEILELLKSQTVTLLSENIHLLWKMGYMPFCLLSNAAPTQLVQSEFQSYRVDSFMLLQVACCFAFVVTLGAAEWFLTSVDSFMLLQVAWCYAFVVTLGAAKWFIKSEDSFMNLQITWFWAFVLEQSSWMVVHHGKLLHSGALIWPWIP